MSSITNNSSNINLYVRVGQGCFPVSLNVNEGKASFDMLIAKMRECFKGIEIPESTKWVFMQACQGTNGIRIVGSNIKRLKDKDEIELELESSNTPNNQLDVNNCKAREIDLQIQLALKNQFLQTHREDNEQLKTEVPKLNENLANKNVSNNNVNNNNVNSVVVRLKLSECKEDIKRLVEINWEAIKNALRYPDDYQLGKNFSPLKNILDRDHKEFTSNFIGSHAVYPIQTLAAVLHMTQSYSMKHNSRLTVEKITPIDLETMIDDERGTIYFSEVEDLFSDLGVHLDSVIYRWNVFFYYMYPQMKRGNFNQNRNSKATEELIEFLKANKLLSTFFFACLAIDGSPWPSQKVNPWKHITM